MKFVLTLTATLLFSTQEVFAMCAMPEHSLCQQMEIEVQSCNAVKEKTSGPAAKDGLGATIFFEIKAKIISSKGLRCTEGVEETTKPGNHPTGSTEKFGASSTRQEFCKDFRGTKIVRVEQGCCDVVGTTCFPYWITDTIN